MSHATIFDVYLNSFYKLSKAFSVNGTVGYNYGRGSNTENLPLIQPFSCLAEENYSTSQFNVAIQLQGNGNQSKYSNFYGADKTPAYAILNRYLGNKFNVQNKNSEIWNRKFFRYQFFHVCRLE